jgi:tetratricopeptide (TPR) repeat protein
VADYNQAINLSPSYAFAYNDRGIIKQRKGDLDEAMADYNRAIKINPEYAAAYRNRGNAKRKSGAGADFDRAVRLGLPAGGVPETPD